MIPPDEFDARCAALTHHYVKAIIGYDGNHLQFGWSDDIPNKLAENSVKADGLATLCADFDARVIEILADLAAEGITAEDIDEIVKASKRLGD